MLTRAETIERNFSALRARVEAVARRAGRDPDEITLVGVTKYVTADAARALFDAGCRDFGESRPQELWSKRKALADLPIRWHLIGHLQRNKARRTATCIDLLHSLDSSPLAAELSRACLETGRALPALVEVNVSGDASKHGLRPEELSEFLAGSADWPGLEIRGLMTMAHREGGPEVARADFRRLRELRDRSRRAGLPLAELSMGMSGDFEAAIEEGATLVRIGSALFEGAS